jgi:8-oxo-dGTP pyrophosphatase MutT (NUDIX family)
MVELHRNPYFSVEYDQDYFSLTFGFRHVIVVPIIENDHLLMIMAKRPILGCSALEFPAGGTEIGESSESCALRELKEETGVVITDCSRLVQLPSINPIPARIKDKTLIYYVNLSMREYESRADHDHEVECLKVLNPHDLLGFVTSGEFFTSTHVSAFFIYLACAEKLSITDHIEE